MRSINAALLICVALLTAALLTGQQSLPAGYAGSDTCQICHEDIYKAIAKSPHHIVNTDKKRGWQGRVCESCHGAGQKHAESADPAAFRAKVQKFTSQDRSARMTGEVEKYGEATASGGMLERRQGGPSGQTSGAEPVARRTAA